MRSHSEKSFTVTPSAHFSQNKMSIRICMFAAIKNLNNKWLNFFSREIARHILKYILIFWENSQSSYKYTISGATVGGMWSHSETCAGFPPPLRWDCGERKTEIFFLVKAVTITMKADLFLQFAHALSLQCLLGKQTLTTIVYLKKKRQSCIYLSTSAKSHEPCCCYLLLMVPRPERTKATALFD